MHSETFTEYKVAINLCEEKGAIHLFIVGVNGHDNDDLEKTWKTLIYVRSQSYFL